MTVLCSTSNKDATRAYRWLRSVADHVGGIINTPFTNLPTDSTEVTPVVLFVIVRGSAKFRVALSVFLFALAGENVRVNEL